MSHVDLLAMVWDVIHSQRISLWAIAMSPYPDFGRVCPMGK